MRIGLMEVRRVGTGCVPSCPGALLTRPSLAAQDGGVKGCSWNICCAVGGRVGVAVGVSRWHGWAVGASSGGELEPGNAMRSTYPSSHFKSPSRLVAATDPLGDERWDRVRARDGSWVIE